MGLYYVLVIVHQTVRLKFFFCKLYWSVYSRSCPGRINAFSSLRLFSDAASCCVHWNISDHLRPVLCFVTNGFQFSFFQPQRKQITFYIRSITKSNQHIVHISIYFLIKHVLVASTASLTRTPIFTFCNCSHRSSRWVNASLNNHSALYIHD